ncbi:peptide chain release factor 1 [Maridesulfovibrio salexigens]|uniref:Peptide chain release factor 1 n=1 Tax=Maridesulfovibrio salexigens (strain ATCC 14822 / DSM 2638 / NCIMB 8403 / VKM B-1763) TaxID=526222 RepID=RF1_MARSD|nr:peptide chain release factor 1 [Maridesulfovibrio salexigens]C6BYQ4.1 RecName: Full=Peptide chain release factor 1; Short=RF-1 [Maridesulfovibrio salexigens DSM 2638]ACS80661.1 peptide chain release factor 1 [Maridesulfovibrio salexigens DSM 2638]
MFAKLEDIERSFMDLEQELADPEVYNNQERYRKVTMAHAELGDVVAAFREYKQLSADLEDNKEMAKDSDPEIREMAEMEIAEIKDRLPKLEEELKLLLLPKDPMDGKNIILEIRAGTGGEEAALFAADLFRMYSRFAESNGWKVEVMNSNPTGTGGFKEIIAAISGSRIYSMMKYESGTHRVQRVPATETQGRIHTSAATVAIMPEAEEVDVQVRNEDLRIDVFRASGPGGQSVNTTDSAIRITHLPTGLVVICQDEKSQHKNKAKAMKVLCSRLLQAEQDKQHAEMAEQRRAQVGSGDRSERIRTYNFPQGRVTDHRINLTLYKLDAVIEGDMQELVESLISHYQSEALKQQAQDG